MDVDIDKSRSGDKASGVDDLGFFKCKGGGAGDENAVAYKEFAGGLVALGGGVDDAGVGEVDQGHRKGVLGLFRRWA